LHLGARRIRAEELADCVEGSWRQTETMQEDIQDWLELDEDDPEFQLLIQEKIAAVIFFINFH
jgi:hypothetical protein